MGLFDFWKKKESSIDFSDENIAELTLKSDLLGQTLMENEMGYFVDHISQIRLAADSKNESEFKKLVLDSGLFFGMSSIGDSIPMDFVKFNKHYGGYLDLLIRMGINNKRIKQVRKTMR